MAIFIFKVIAIIVRTIAKPLISWASYYKRMQLQEPNSKFQYLRRRIIWLGQMTNYYNTKLNRKLFRLPAHDPIKMLTEEKAIEKGSEFFSEFLIYGVLLMIPISEWYRQNKINKTKEFVKEQGIRRLRNDIDGIIIENKKIKSELKEIKNILVQINSKI
jgi:hypothetical protein